MQYSLSINQFAVIELGLDKQLNAIDLLLFDYIYQTMNNANSVKRIVGTEEYTMIKHSMVQEDAPILGINHRDTFRKHMNKLCAAGLIERYESNQVENVSFYKMGELFEALTNQN